MQSKVVQKMSSECSSGCRSGWTMYLVSSFQVEDEEQEEEEEDLSMISDASSGPPHLLEDVELGCFHHQSNGGSYSSLLPTAAFGRESSGNNNSNSKKKKKKKKKKNKRGDAEQKVKHSSVLEDTASSQLFSSSKNDFNECNYHHMKQCIEECLDLSYDLSSTKFNTKAVPKEQMDHTKVSPDIQEKKGAGKM